MKICEHCGMSFPSRKTIEGKSRNLANRKYCFSCSPFKAHNTRPIGHKAHQLAKKELPLITKRNRSNCGESNLDNFYGRKTRMCKQCDKIYVMEKARVNKRKARQYLGGKCALCGFDRFEVALDIHHLDPQIKDKYFNTMRGWKWSRVEKELQHCILLCKVCHAACHHGLITILKL
jgi:hypothetical protein